MKENIELKYSFQNYVYFSRWVSYWHQINEVLKLEPKNALLIGKGDGIVENILKNYIKEVKIMDIDSGLKPDITASVEKIPFDDNSYDLILCAEVLEHLPFEKFEGALKELNRTAREFIVLSLPHFGPPIQLHFKIPFIKEIKVSFKIPFPIKHDLKGEHYWEMGKRGYLSLKIANIIKKYFIIKNEFTPFENQYHHFYILKKIDL